MGATGPGLPQLFGFWGGGGGGGAGEGGIRTSYMLRPCTKHWYFCRIFASLRNTLRKDVEQDTLPQASMLFATMPRTPVVTLILPLCATYCTRMWNKQSCHKCPCPWCPCPKRWYLQRCRLFFQHTAQGCGAGHIVTSVHANFDDA